MSDSIPQNLTQCSSDFIESPQKKQCSKCKEFFPATTKYFNRDKHKPDGLTSACKKDIKQFRDEISNQENPPCSRCKYRPPVPGRKVCERCGEQARVYNASIKEERAQHRAELLAQGICPKCWSRPIKEGHNKCSTCIENAAASKQRHKEYDKQWRKAKYDRDQQKILAGYKERREKLKIEVLAAYGSVCACCGESHPVFLTIDHIDGSGNKHRKEQNITSRFYEWLRKNGFPSGFQVLCFNCNMAKFRLGQCPHPHYKT